MTSANDALATLGLDLGSNEAAAENTVALTASTDHSDTPADTTENDTDDTTEPSAADEAAFEVGDTEDLVFNEIPAQHRLGGGGGGRSRYDFASLAAPSVDAAGKAVYPAKLIKFGTGDDKKFRRSVQSAVAAVNKKAKEVGEATYFLTRAVDRAGKFVGIAIIRTDDRPAD